MYSCYVYYVCMAASSPSLWPSAVKVLDTIEDLPDPETRAALLRGNAHRILGICDTTVG